VPVGEEVIDIQIKSGKSGFELEGSRVLVTGGCGLIGSHTVDALLREKVGEIIVLDKFINESNLAGALPSGKVRLVQGEFGDRRTLRSLLQGTDYVYHLAASLLVTEGQKNPRGILEDINSFFELLVMLVEHGIKKLIFASSVSVYGAPKNPELEMTEDTPFNGRAMYAAGKIAGEQFCRVFNELHGLDYLALRYSVVYGPRQHPKGYYTQLIIRILDAIKRRQPLELEEGEESELQDFVYVGDVAEANILAMKSPASDCALNIVAGKSVNVLDVAKSIMQLKATEVPIKRVPRRRFVYVPVRRFSGQRAAEAINFKASTSLLKGLQQLVQ
jgi:UDP-glucose 4-epimerase